MKSGRGCPTRIPVPVDPRNSRNHQGSSGRCCKVAFHTRDDVLILIFFPTMAVDQDKVRETKENEGWKEKTGRGRYREMMKKAVEMGTRVKSS